MKAKNMIRGLLPMAAALMLTACSSDDIIEVNNAVPETTTIPFSVTVNQGGATRVGVGDDMKTLYFTAGDKLYISSDERTDITGTLTLKDGDENKSTVTFEGAITYTSYLGEPEGTTTIIASTMDPAASPVVALQSNIATAVSNCSNLLGTSTYVLRSFTLQQQVAFLNFQITFNDGTTTSNSLKFAIINDCGGTSEVILVPGLSLPATHATGSTTANFVLPMDAMTGLTSAVLRITKTVGGNDSYIDKTLTDKTLLGKVYNVSRTVESTDAWTTVTGTRTVADVTDGDQGKLICTAGHIHSYNSDTKCTAARVAMIAYVGDGETNTSYNKGLAIALTDASSSCPWNSDVYGSNGVSNSSSFATHKTFLNGIADTETLITKYGEGYAAYVAKNCGVAVPTGTSGWFLPSTGQWLKFFETAGVDVASWTDWRNPPEPEADNWTKVKTFMENAATGSSVKEKTYWTSSEGGYATCAVAVKFNSTDGVFWDYWATMSYKYFVRPFLAF